MRGWTLRMTILVVAEAAVIVLLAVVVIGMLRSHAEILRKLHELGAGDDTTEGEPFQTTDDVAQPRVAGSHAADIAGTAPTGGAVAIRLRRPGTATLLAFMSTSCPTCERFWPRFAEPHSLAALGDARLVVVTRGSQDERPAQVAQVVPAGVTVVMSTQAWDDYQIPGSPYFVMVDGDRGVVTGEGSAGDWDKLLDLMGIADGDVSPGAGGNDLAREARVDKELADAGILPGDPQLYGEHELQTDPGA